MASWLDTCCMVLERRLPERLDALDEDDRAEHPWWKCKKWALHILIRTFERYKNKPNANSMSFSYLLDMDHQQIYLKDNHMNALNLLIFILKVFPV